MNFDESLKQKKQREEASILQERERERALTITERTLSEF